MTEFIKVMTKVSIIAVLFVPIGILTLLIWIFGGWTKGFDYMPNPMYSLLDWLDN